MFDETYYAKAGCIQVTDAGPEECRVDSGDERCWLDNEWDTGAWVHPPLGKLTIGLGIKAFSMSCSDGGSRRRSRASASRSSPR